MYCSIAMKLFLVLSLWLKQKWEGLFWNNYATPISNFVMNSWTVTTLFCITRFEPYIFWEEWSTVKKGSHFSCGWWREVGKDLKKNYFWHSEDLESRLFNVKCGFGSTTTCILRVYEGLSQALFQTMNVIVVCSKTINDFPLPIM